MVKPLFDVLVAALALVILFPVMVVITFLLMLANSGSAFFTQERVGKGKRIFMVVKFKTMNDRCDEHGQLLPDSVRLTTVGKWIRKTSLDELPQLWNVIRGEMSFVGPRPLLVEYLPLWSAEQLRRLEVTPGITGWAQVNGRNQISWRDKFTLDVWYVDHQSIWLDFKILLMTVWKVIKAEGISGVGVATAEKFNGSN
ncbi:MAG TPA: sugar transferase [Cyclobacteriaceae bacterium]|nr:sugar transferase [Cyclobacteriaceae bacterium]